MTTSVGDDDVTSVSGRCTKFVQAVLQKYVCVILAKCSENIVKKSRVSSSRIVIWSIVTS